MSTFRLLVGWQLLGIAAFTLCLQLMILESVVNLYDFIKFKWFRCIKLCFRPSSYIRWHKILYLPSISGQEESGDYVFSVAYPTWYHVIDALYFYCCCLASFFATIKYGKGNKGMIGSLTLLRWKNCRYPIYHIPMGRTIKDLLTCFLTFHTLSSSFQGIIPFVLWTTEFTIAYIPFQFQTLFFTLLVSIRNILYSISFISCPDMDLEDDMENCSRKRKEGENISLPPFGLATYKMQGDVWISDRSGRDQERLMSLFSVADSWLKQLGVQHHDFNYMSIRRGWWNHLCTLTMELTTGYPFLLWPLWNLVLSLESMISLWTKNHRCILCKGISLFMQSPPFPKSRIAVIISLWLLWQPFCIGKSLAFKR